MDNFKLVDYSDSDSDNDTDGTVSVQLLDSEGRQVAVVEPTPQNVAVVNPVISFDPMESHIQEDLDGTGIFEPEADDPLSTQATQGSSSSNPIDPSFVSQDIAEALEIEIPRENVDVIVISDSSQDTIIISEPGNLDDAMSATSGNYSLLYILLSTVNCFNQKN